MMIDYADQSALIASAKTPEERPVGLAAKMQRAKEYMGEKYCFHPNYKKPWWHTTAIKHSALLSPIREKALIAGRI